MAGGFKSAVKERVRYRPGTAPSARFQNGGGRNHGAGNCIRASRFAQHRQRQPRTTIDAQKKVADLPLLGKNPYTFAYHAAGVLHINPQGEHYGSPVRQRRHGLSFDRRRPPFTNEFLLDGAPNTNTSGTMSAASVSCRRRGTEEVAVLNNNYDAQFGRTGGGVVQAR
jgi:hypothetical protein